MNVCKRCGSENIKTTLADENSPHYAKALCKDCGFFIWISKPKNKNKRRNKRLRPDVDYCEICFRTNIILHEHHILPYHKYPELDSDPHNRLVLCEQCHQIIHQIQKIAGVLWEN